MSNRQERRASQRQPRPINRPEAVMVPIDKLVLRFGPVTQAEREGFTFTASSVDHVNLSS
jgi:hypothetical protein